MPELTAPRDILAQVMKDGKDVMVPLLAEQLKREAIDEVPSDEQRRLWWQRALTPEQEQQEWMNEMAARGLTELIPGSPEVTEIGLKIAPKVYPSRFDMMTAEGRDSQSAQAVWSWKMAKTKPPEPKVEEQPVMPTEGEAY